jgi:hypothetical protein
MACWEDDVIQSEKLDLMMQGVSLKNVTDLKYEIFTSSCDSFLLLLALTI